MLACHPPALYSEFLRIKADGISNYFLKPRGTKTKSSGDAEVVEACGCALSKLRARILCIKNRDIKPCVKH